MVPALPADRHGGAQKGRPRGQLGVTADQHHLGALLQQFDGPLEAAPKPAVVVVEQGQELPAARRRCPVPGPGRSPTLGVLDDVDGDVEAPFRPDCLHGGEGPREAFGAAARRDEDVDGGEREHGWGRV